jgi:peroxiredoxin
MIGLWTVAAGQPLALPGNPVGQPPSLRRPGERAVGLTPEIESFLKKLIETYQKAETYRDRGRVILTQTSGRVKTTTEMPMELTFQRPNRLLLDAGQYTVASDGQKLYFVVPALNQYTMATAPERLEKSHLQAGSVLGGVDEGHPELLDFLIRPDAYKLLVEQMVKVAWKPDVSLDGIGCRVLNYETAQAAKVIVTVDTNRMVILKVEGDVAAGVPSDRMAAPSAPPAMQTRLTYELWPVDLGVKLAATNFAFTPPAGFKRVTDFDAGGPADFEHSNEQPGAQGAHLLGKPLSNVTVTDLEGKSASPADLKGKVALLFFWSLDGGEHCLRSIPLVQQVAERFKNQPVLVWGVTPDADQKEVVAQLMKLKQATFRTLLDQDRRWAMSLQLGGVPTFVIAGQDGAVRWAKLGAPPDLKEELIRQIEQLLPKK